MKNVMVAVLTGASLLCAAGVSSQAFAQTPTEKKAEAKKKPVAKKSTHTEHKRTTSRRRASAHKVAATPAAVMMPAGAEKWTCEDNNALYIAGDMKRDQILTVHWDNRNYKLPRETTTTGADRFYDPASGLDLVVIPTKAMLFDDHGDRTRLADECKTIAMSTQNAPAPTQSNELRNNK